VLPLQIAAAEAGVPLEIIDVAEDERTGVYRHALLLSRPDLHVAWRGDALPDDVDGLVNRIRGV